MEIFTKTRFLWTRTFNGSLNILNIFIIRTFKGNKFIKHCNVLFEKKYNHNYV